MNGALRRLILTAFFLVATPIVAEPLRIGKITIRTLDVYSSEEIERGAFYRLADRFHIETRGSVIEQFLLFREGDVYSPERLAETERNLRALTFLKSASVVASPPRNGVVDVTVTTQDSWSIAPETQAGSKGGTNTFGATIADTNVLGLGKALEVGWDRGLDRTRIVFDYKDPAFFRPYWKSHLLYAMTSDGYERRFNVARPFYAFTTEWSSYLGFNSFKRDDRLYSSGLERSRFSHTHRQIIASYGLARNPTDHHARRVTGGVRFTHDDFTPIEGHSTLVPSSRDFRYLFVRYESAQNDFIKINFVNRDLRFEDFNLGLQYAVEGALSPRLLAAPANSGFISLTVAEGARVTENGFVMASATGSTRMESGFRNAIASATATYVRKRPGNYPTAFVARTVVNSGWRLDNEVQFLADGMTGLRGYRTRMFAGRRSVVVNLEQRLYLGREILQLASPGLVAFVDVGDAWDRNFAPKSDVGFGIRVGLPRTPKNLVRVDFAYALQRDPLGRRGWLVSFSSGQAF